MKISYYTIDDLRLGYDSRGIDGWRLRQFLCLDDALDHYMSLSPSAEKSLGLTDGVHPLELVRCLPLFPDDHEGEDILASDYRAFPLWEQEAEAARATEICIHKLSLRYALCDNMIAPIPAPEGLPQTLRDKYLWLNAVGDEMSAIRWAYVAGRGWVSPGMLKACTQAQPLVLKYRADGITSQGAYLSLEVEPWEYELLLRRTLERMEQNKIEGGTKA